MSVRSLNGLGNGNVRSLNGLNNLSGIKTKYDYNGNVVNGSLLIGNGSTGNFETNTLTQGTNITITNSSGNISIASTDTNTEYTLQSPLSFISANKIQLQQTLFNISTTIADNDYVPYFNSNGNFDRITFANLKTQIPDTNTTYTGASPIVLSGTQFEMDFSGLLDYGGETITNATEFLVSTDGIKTMRALTYSKLKTDLDQTLFQYETETSINDADLVLFFDETGIVSNKYKNITFEIFRNLLCNSAISFGAGTTTSQRTLGNTTYTTQINGSEVVITNGTYRIELNTDGSFKYKSATKTLFGSKPLDTIVDSDNFSVGCPSFLKAISLNNTATTGQWNSLITLRKALNSNTTAYSMRIYDYVAGTTDYQYFGIFSNNNVGDQASPTCPFQIRNDGYIELKANFTNNITNINNLGNNVVPQLKYIARSTTGSYHPMNHMGLASGASWTRWNYSVSGGGTDYGGIAYSFGNVGLDCISWDYTGNFWYTGALNPSDKRIKKDIIDADLDECISVMKSIKLKKYKYTDAYQETYNTTKGEVYGFLADDIIENEYLNYCGNVGDRPKDLKNGTSLENFKTIEKSKILSVLWGVCNFQQNKIEALESEIANIKSVLNL